MQLIFSTVLTNFLSTFEECVSLLTEGIVRASIAVYNAVLDNLKPTPSKPHYTFNLRDMSKVTHHHPLHSIFTLF
jgi:dynein heavy chain, axonemal